METNKPKIQNEGQCITVKRAFSTVPKEILLKFLIIGDYGVGKTAIVRRYAEGKFSSNYKITIGADFAVKTLYWDSKTVINIQLWDIAGHERFGYMTRVYYKYAVAAVLVFDLSRHATFNSVIKVKDIVACVYDGKWYLGVIQEVSIENGDCKIYFYEPTGPGLHLRFHRMTGLGTNSENLEEANTYGVNYCHWPITQHNTKTQQRNLPTPSGMPKLVEWLNDLRDKVTLSDGSPIPVVLLANKCDVLGTTVSTDNIKKFCKECKIDAWYITSAKENINIDDAMEFLVEHAISVQNNETRGESIIVNDSGKYNNKGFNTHRPCCN